MPIALPTRKPHAAEYTPFEMIEYSDTVLKHEVRVHVAAPVDKCYSIWSDRLNWLQWFDMIEEVRGLACGFRGSMVNARGRMSLAYL
jgi:uncharacterized membrane protein